MAAIVRSILRESEGVEPPGPRRRDVVLAGFLALWAVADIPEGVVTWEPATSLVGLVTAVVVVWRRGRPLAVAVGVFGLQFAVDVLSGLADAQAELPFGQVVVMAVVAYALCRWAGWRELIIGLSVLAGLQLAGEPLAGVTEWADAYERALTWGLGAAIGLAVRYRSASLSYRAAQVRSEERERIARELHDVIAHHVSAIAVQSEGARAVAAGHPGTVTEALERIHRSASQALVDTRQIVGLLRDPGDEGRLRPQRGIDQLASLATDGDVRPAVVVSMDPEVGDVSAGVGAGIFRIVQEALTNVRRHASGASEVSITIGRDANSVTVVVIDDGEPVVERPGPGYGLIGMHERAVMLGGALDVGPRLEGGGWRVAATIPLDGAGA